MCDDVCQGDMDRYKVLTSLLKKHVHSQMKKQKTGELKVSRVSGKWGREGIIGTERYERPWENVGEIRERTAFPRKSHPM